MADSLIPRNVADGSKPPKSRKKEINPLTPDQAKTFLQAARGDRFYALYVFAIHYGLRQGELLGLEWDDVDLANGTLHVRRTMSESRVGRIEGRPKNERGRRIDISPSVVEILARRSGVSHAEQYARQFEQPVAAELFTPIEFLRSATHKIPRPQTHMRNNKIP